MSKTHSYRIQLHCDKIMHGKIKVFAERRGLSQSAAARLLIERALLKNDDEVSEKLDRINYQLKTILHSSVSSRVFASLAAESSGAVFSSDEIKGRISKVLHRYMNKAAA